MRLDSLSSSSSDTHGADMRVLRREHLVTAHAARAFAAEDLIRKKLSDQCFPWILPGRGFHGKQRAALTFYALAHPAIQLPPCSFTCSHTKQAGLICLRIPEATWSASGHGCPARSISAPLMITESSLRLVPRTQRGNKRT